MSHWDLTSTSPYPIGTCPPPSLDPIEYEPSRGLGFLPLVGAAAGTETGQNLIGGTVDAVTGFFGGLFGDTSVDKARRIIAGDLPCGGPYSAADLEVALSVAPRGTPGDIGQLGTNEGAQAAVRAGADMFTCCSLGGRGLANALAFVANGKYDCSASNRDLPAQNHADTLLANYNAQVAESSVGSPTAGWDAPAAFGPSGVPTLFAGMGGGGGGPLLLLVGLGLAAAVFTGGLRGGRRL